MNKNKTITSLYNHFKNTSEKINLYKQDKKCFNCQGDTEGYFWVSKQGNSYCLNCNSNNYGDKEPEINTVFNGTAWANMIVQRCKDKGLHFTKTINYEAMTYSFKNLDGRPTKNVMCAYCQTHSYEYETVKKGNHERK